MKKLFAFSIIVFAITFLSAGQAATGLSNGQAGATDQMLVEVALVSASMRAGGAITHSSHLFKK